MFDYAAIALVLILRLIGIYRRRRLTQRVRQLASDAAAAAAIAAQPADE